MDQLPLPDDHWYYVEGLERRGPYFVTMTPAVLGFTRGQEAAERRATGLRLAGVVLVQVRRAW